MNYKTPIGEDKTVWEKDDSWVFNGGLRTCGLVPKIRRKEVNRDMDDYRPNNRDLTGSGIKREYYSSVDAGNYIGIDPNTFLRKVKEHGLKPVRKGQKKYSHEQVEQIKKSLPKFFNKRDRAWTHADIIEEYKLTKEQILSHTEKEPLNYQVVTRMVKKFKNK